MKKQVVFILTAIMLCLCFAFSACGETGGNGGNGENGDNHDADPTRVSEQTISTSALPVIFLGYPIWWGIAPKIIYTFLESYDFSGKTIVPFCTSGSSGITASIPDLKAIASGATWLSGKRFSSSPSKSEAEEWINGLSG